MHQEFFTSTLDDVNDEHSESIRHDITVIEKRYQNTWSTEIFADYCWSLISEGTVEKYERIKVNRKNILYTVVSKPDVAEQICFYYYD